MQTARRIRLAMIAIAAFAGLSVAGDALAQPTPARVALVIGNAAYTLAPALPACATSANLVAGRLKAAGFDVAERLDATNGAIGAALIDFAQAVAMHPGTAAVVYFCGYAVSYQDRDFVLPISATLKRPSDTLTEGVLERAPGATVAGSAHAGPALVLLDLFGLPNDAATAPTATLAQGSANGRLAIAVALDAPGPDAATPAATALDTVLSQKEVKLPGLIAHLLTLTPSGPSFIGQREATADLLLLGEPQTPSWAPATAGTAAAQPTQVSPALPAPAAASGPPAPQTPAETQAALPTSREPALPPQAASPAPPPAAVASPAVTPQAPPAPSRPPLPDEAKMTDADRRDVQIALARLGYYDGQIDGVFGPDTRAAIRRWEHEAGAEMTGTLSGAQATRLVTQEVPLPMGSDKAVAQVNRHVPQRQIVMPPVRQPQIVMAPTRQSQIVTPPARPRPWWQFW